MMDILISETCWVHKTWNKITSDIKLVLYSSSITMMHGPINIRFLLFIQALQLCQNLITANPYLPYTTEIVSYPQSTYYCPYFMYIMFKSYPYSLLPCSFRPLGTMHIPLAHSWSGSYLLRLRICVPILHHVSLSPLHISQCIPNCFACGTLLDSKNNQWSWQPCSRKHRVSGR